MMTDQSQPPQGPNITVLIGQMTIDAWVMRQRLVALQAEHEALKQARQKQTEPPTKTGD